MLHIPGGLSNTYTFELPKDLPPGAYWYHSHLHTLTTSHVYYGLAGLLAIGRTDGNLPLVVVQLRGLPMKSLKRVPSQHWYRLQRLAKDSGTACLVVTPAPMVPSARKRW